VIHTYIPTFSGTTITLNKWDPTITDVLPDIEYYKWQSA